MLALLAALSGWTAACGAGGGGQGDATVMPGDDATAMGGEDAAADAPASVYDGDPNLLPDGAPNPCIGAMTCGECTSRTPCGFCNGQCLAGTAEGSFDGTCTGAQWMWRGVQCPGVGMQCPSHADCMSCAQDPNGCGWCANAARCVSGDRAGPASPVDGCSPAAGTWIYNLDMMMCR